MRIQKKFQGTIPKNKILDTYSTSKTDTYSCNKINSLIGTGGGGGGDVNIEDISSKMSKVLYDNPTGTNTTVNLSETTANFKYLDIYCLSSDNTYTTVRVHEPNGKRVTAMSGWFGAAAYFKNCVLVINEAVISVTQGNNAQITGSNTCSSVAMADAIKVVKVVGYYDENVLIIGNNGEIVNTNKPKSIMTLKLDADVTCVNSVYTHLNLSLYSKEGEGLTYENGSVKIGKGISKVKVNAQAKYATGVEGAKHIHIDKNETTVAWNYGPCIEVGQAVDAIITPVVVDVKEGDLIDLKYYANSKDKVSGHATNYTFLTVEAVEDGQNITINNYSGSDLTLDKIYPIGSIYMTINDINPKDLFGGTWEQIKDRFLLSAGDTYNAGDMDGEAEVKLTVNEMPSHRHNLEDAAYSGQVGVLGVREDGGGGAGKVPTYKQTNSYSSYRAAETGGGQPHNNMPPYLTVYMWQRIG